MTRMILLTLATVACASAHLELNPTSVVPETGQGFGGLVNVLTVQQNTFESGCSAWNGTTTIVGSSACTQAGLSGTYTGGNEAGSIPNQNFSPSFGYLGITSLDSSSFHIFFNADQTGSSPLITLQSLTLTIYSSTGGIVATIPTLAGATFDSSTPQQGVGKSGWLITVSANEVIPITSDEHIGLSANLGCKAGQPITSGCATSNDGPDTFTVQAAPGNPVPDPASIFTLGSALIVAGGYARRRLRRA